MAFLAARALGNESPVCAACISNRTFRIQEVKFHCLAEHSTLPLRRPAFAATTPSPRQSVLRTPPQASPLPMSAPPATPPDPESAPSSALPAQTDVPEVPDLAGASSEPPAKKAKLSNGGRAGAEHPSPSDEPNETVYVRNLNEDVPLANLRTTLSNLFGLFGKVVAVQAHKSVRMRGQAFVTMATPAAAAQAVQDLHGFMLYGRTMQPSFAQHRSTAAVQREAAREAKRALAAAAAHGDAAAAAAAQQTKDEVVTGHKAWLKVHQKQQRRGNILRRKQLDAKIAAQRGTHSHCPTRVRCGGDCSHLTPSVLLFCCRRRTNDQAQGRHGLCGRVPSAKQGHLPPGSTRLDHAGRHTDPARRRGPCAVWIRSQHHSSQPKHCVCRVCRHCNFSHGQNPARWARVLIGRPT